MIQDFDIYFPDQEDDQLIYDKSDEQFMYEFFPDSAKKTMSDLI